MLSSLLFHNIIDQKKNKTQKWLINTFSFWRSLTSPATLPETELSRVALRYFKKTVGASRTQGGTRWSKKHSTLYFPGTGKRHGLVVSGMALGEFRGNTEGYIVWISISLHRNTFNFSQLERNSPGVADALRGNSHGSTCHMFGVWKKGFHQHQIKIHNGERFTETKNSDIHLQTSI